MKYLLNKLFQKKSILYLNSLYILVTWRKKTKKGLSKLQSVIDFDFYLLFTQDRSDNISHKESQIST